jgi:hypothetical protein
VHPAAPSNGWPHEELERSVLHSYPHTPPPDQCAQLAGELGMKGLIEVKDPGFEREAVDILRRFKPDADLNFFSFHPEVTRTLHSIVPERPIGLLSDLQEPAKTGAELVADARDAKASFVGLNVRQTSDVVLKAVNDAKLGTTVWTVVTPADHVRLLSHPLVTSVISDAPQVAMSARTALYGDAATAAVRMLHVV